MTGPWWVSAGTLVKCFELAFMSSLIRIVALLLALTVFITPVYVALLVASTEPSRSLQHVKPRSANINDVNPLPHARGFFIFLISLVHIAWAQDSRTHAIDTFLEKAIAKDSSTSGMRNATNVAIHSLSSIAAPAASSQSMPPGRACAHTVRAPISRCKRRTFALNPRKWQSRFTLT